MIQPLYKDHDSVPIHIFGMNYRTSPAELRERLAIPASAASALLKSAREVEGIAEVSFLNTCNRVEFLYVTSDTGVDEKRIHAELLQLLCLQTGAAFHEVRRSVFELHGHEAVLHVFRVSSGLDSMLLGEPQILGQVKDAYEIAQAAATVGPTLHRLFQRAFSGAKQARTETGLGRLPVSVAYAARELAVQIFEDLRSLTVILVGAGATGELTLRHFAAAGVSKIYLLNRTLERAAEKAAHFGAAAAPLTQLEPLLPLADIVIGCATAETNSRIVTEAMALESRKQRKGRAQFFVDLGMPRNFAPEIGEISDVMLYTLDDLETVVRSNLDERKGAAISAERIIALEVEKFVAWFHGKEIESAIGMLMANVDTLRHDEIQKSMRQLLRANFTPAQLTMVRECLVTLTGSVSQKILQPTIEILKREGRTDRDLLETFRRIFRLRKTQD